MKLKISIVWDQLQVSEAPKVQILRWKSLIIEVVVGKFEIRPNLKWVLTW